MNKKIETMLQEAFENYDFGENVNVVDMDGWQSDGSNDFIRIVYIEDTFNNQSEDLKQSTSDKVSFHVVLDNDKNEVKEVYALMVESGNIIGESFKGSLVKNKM